MLIFIFNKYFLISYILRGSQKHRIFYPFVFTGHLTKLPRGKQAREDGLAFTTSPKKALFLSNPDEIREMRFSKDSALNYLEDHYSTRLSFLHLLWQLPSFQVIIEANSCCFPYEKSICILLAFVLHYGLNVQSVFTLSA